ncbi:MAG: hypothetical protein IKK81_05900 [Prevotella sp.]|nr:hypothetical protein [Prevotella sp.]
MKRIFTTLSIVCLFACAMFGQSSFLDSKKVWHTVWNNTVKTVHRYYYVDEKKYENKLPFWTTYQKMYVKTSKDDDTQGEFVANLLETDGALYCQWRNSNEWILLYDSNLPEGGLTESGYKVVKTDEIILGDRTTRRYKYEKTQGNEKLEYIWVDGIGSLCGPLVAEARLPGNYETLVDVEVDGKVIATHELLTQADGFVVNLNETSLEQGVKDIKTPVHYLTISGKPKTDDLDYIRNMIMPDIKGLNLRNLDLDTIPAKAFYTTISNNKRIILPKTLKHLADSALCTVPREISEMDLIFELTSPTFPTLGKDVYAEKLEDQDYVTMPIIVPSADNEAFRCKIHTYNIDILYSADGTTAYYCNNGYEIAEGTRIINGGFMENGQTTDFYISATVDSIGDRAFANVGLVLYTGYPGEDMTCYAPNPPKLGKDVFVNSMIYHIPVYVPSKSYDIYKTTEVWKDFDLRRLVDDGIEDITTGKQSSNAFFDLQGRKVKRPTKGLYIKDGKKVLIK